MTEPTTEDLAEQSGRAADFDAFFAEESATRPRQTLTLYGTEYTLPDSLPLMFTLQMERIQNSSDPDDIRKMLATLYGCNTLDDWAEHGMTDRQLSVVLIYSAANIKTPNSTSMQRAAQLHDEQDARKTEGKAPAPNRTARRKKKRPSSGKRS
ncbi:hypothetical protein [Streptomyces sp. NBC_01180]|uniref:hypothetical protein n=1 Tax=Streptomyces sp. NBC_01180 TaxID=2903763 RepID=UPI00386BBC21|nr:hypothetical protein OG708_17790 [Streptomyces sp. NBC_01180]